MPDDDDASAVSHFESAEEDGGEDPLDGQIGNNLGLTK